MVKVLAFLISVMAACPCSFFLDSIKTRARESARAFETS
jgi:hypothetical protein